MKRKRMINEYEYCGYCGSCNWEAAVCDECGMPSLHVKYENAKQRIAELNMEKAQADAGWAREVEKRDALLDEILDADIPWAHGHMKLRHTAVVKAILKQREKTDE